MVEVTVVGGCSPGGLGGCSPAVVTSQGKVGFLVPPRFSYDSGFGGEGVHIAPEEIPLLTVAPQYTPTLWTRHFEGEAGYTRSSKGVKNKGNFGEKLGSSQKLQDPDIFPRNGGHVG